MGSARRRASVIFTSLAIALHCAPPADCTADGDSVATLRGRVMEAGTGQPIAQALVAIRDGGFDVKTDADGRFTLAGLPEGDAEVSVTTAGYGAVKCTVRVETGAAELEIRLVPDALQRAEEIVVETPAFEPTDAAAPVEHMLAGAELRSLASVLADDPLRALQALPGIASGDDFSATFAARGSGFSTVGFYLDGVLMSAPFHTVRDVNDSFSLTILNGDLVQSLSLLSSGAPARYGDRTGAVFNVRTRDGSQQEFLGRASLGATGVFASLEGPLGREKQTSWLVSARKSYVDYVLNQIDDAPSMILGYYDATAKLAHHPTASQTLSLLLLHGRSRWRSTESDSEADDLSNADAETDLASLEWRFLPSTRTWLEAGVSWLQETGRNRALDGTDRFRSAGSQWAVRADAARVLQRHRVEAGFLLRGLAEQAIGHDFDKLLARYRMAQDYDASSAQWGVYLQDTWTRFDDRLSLTLGTRFDRFGETSEGRLLPRAALTVALSKRTKAVAAFGSYAQFPAFAQLHGENGNSHLAAQRSRHASVALERLLNDSLRLRVEAYDVEDDGLFFSHEMEWRIEQGRILAPRRGAPLGNSLSGRSRGVELLVQRRSTKGPSAWIAYSLGHARRAESDGGLSFDGDYDQRHTLTIHGSQRVGETLNLSTKYRYGSGFPVQGFYRREGDAILLSAERNGLRVGAYSRWDVRVDKAFRVGGSRLTLYGEVINLLNRTQRRYTGLRRVSRQTGEVLLRDDTLLPILPSLGITLDF